MSQCRIQVPQDLSPEAKQKLKEFEELLNKERRGGKKKGAA